MYKDRIRFLVIPAMFAGPNLWSGQEVTRMNAAAYLRSRTVRALRNRKALLRAAAVSFAIAAAIAIASGQLKAQNHGGAEGGPALVNPSVGIFSYFFPGAL